MTTRPRSIVLATWCGVIGYAIGLIAVPARWARSVAEIGLLNQVLAVAVPVMLFGLLYYFANSKRNWARLALLVLPGLSFPGYLLSVVAADDLLYRTTQLLQLLFFAGSFTFFLSKSARHWYKT